MANKYEFEYDFAIDNQTSGIEQESFEDLGQDFDLSESNEYSQVEWSGEGAEEQIESLQEDVADQTFGDQTQVLIEIPFEEIGGISEEQQISDQMVCYVVDNDISVEDVEGLSNDPEWQSYSQEFNRIYGIEIEDPSEVSSTDQGFYEEVAPERVYDNFEQSIMDRDPDFYDSGVFYEQGINEYGFQGTCGPTSQANAVNYLLGTNELTENKVLTIAINNGLCETQGEPGACGGTTTGQFMQLYDRVNEQVGDKIDTELYEYDNALSVEEMASAIESGSVLNVAVDSSVLWDRDGGFGSGFFNREEVYSDHWITVVGVDRNSDGSINGFNIVDSGGGVNYVDADKYDRMCFGSWGRKVIDPTCIVVSKK